MKTAVLATAILTIVFLIEILAQMGSVKANPFDYPTMSIESPKFYKSEVYHSTNVPIEVIVFPHRSNIEFTEIVYSIDASPNRTLSTYTIPSSSGYFAKGELSNLTDGFHSFTAYSSDVQGEMVSSSITFQVDTRGSYDILITVVAIAISMLVVCSLTVIVIYRKRHFG